MAESDPKKIRPFGQTSDRRNMDSEEDPLVELARIVSEDSGGFYGARAEKPRPQRSGPMDRNAYSADLESELLQELESSFSPRPSPGQPLRAMPADSAPRNAAPSLPADDSDDLLRSIERQLGEFERRTQASRPVAPVPARPVEPQWENTAEEAYFDEGDEGQSPAEPEPDFSRQSQLEDRRVAEARERIGRVRTSGRTPDRPDDRASEPPQRPAQGRPQSPAERLFAGPRERESGEDRQEPTRLPLRRRDPPLEAGQDRGFPVAAGFAAGATRGWDEEETTGNFDSGDHIQPLNQGGRHSLVPQDSYPAELRTSFGAFDDASRSEQDSYDSAGQNDAFSREELEPRYADRNFGGHWQDPDHPDEDGAEGEPRIAPAVGLGEHRGSAERAGGSRRTGLIAAATVLGVVVIGGAAAMYMRSGETVPSGPPPVIAAPEGEVKVEPETPVQAEAETVGEAVYNRVAGNAPAAEEQVVDGAEEPREISRIVLPPPQENTDQALVRPVGEAGADAAAPDPATGEVAVADPDIGPRRVRTYVVRPDGTISETVAGAPAEPASDTPAVAQEQQVAAVVPPPGEPMIPVRVPTTEIDGTGQPQAVQPEPRPAAAPAQAAAPPAATLPEPPPAQTAAASAVPPAAAPTPAGSPAAAEAPAPTAAATAPIAAVQPTPAPAAAPAAADGYVVQISSQRSMADAQSSWASAKGRYSSVLGNMDPNIQEADLGDKGVYYRVRVGPWPSRAEAVQVCESLRAAGGDCIVTR